MAKRQSSREPLKDLSDRAKEYTEGEEDKSYIQSIGRPRKRRSDAVWPEDATDKHKGSSTLSVRLPDDLADRVRAEAAGDGQSINSWLLALIQAYFEG